MDEVDRGHKIFQSGGYVRPHCPQVGRRERKKKEVEQRIREAALDLFRIRGYEATTVEEIAERADVAKGTFFNYFPRKDAVLESLAEEVVSDLFEELGPVDSWAGSPRDQLLRLFIRVGDLVGGDPELSKVMLIENMRNAWMRPGADALEQEFHALILTVLRRAAERGEIERATDVALAARLLEAAQFTTMVDWLRAGAPEDGYRRELTARFDIIFRGLGMSEVAAKGAGT
jgi:TetR/AcrR family transcriptional regulator, cholesterol catabolism regulator